MKITRIGTDYTDKESRYVSTGIFLFIRGGLRFQVPSYKFQVVVLTAGYFNIRLFWWMINNEKSGSLGTWNLEL